MRVFVIPPEPGTMHPADISHTLESMQNLVGGFIEVVNLPQLRERGIALVVNEEGVLRGLPYNLNLWPFFYVGQVFMVGVTGEEFASLTEVQEDFIRAWLAGLTT